MGSIVTTGHSRAHRCKTTTTSWSNVSKIFVRSGKQSTAKLPGRRTIRTSLFHHLLYTAHTRWCNRIQNDLKILTERLSRINDSLARKVAARNEYDQSIQETEAAYLKILESSQTLLHVLKRESANLQKKSQASS